MTGLQLRAVLEQRRINVELQVAPGEVVAILGANGAGKSSVLHMIAGLLRPDRGAVTVGGRALTDTESGVQVPVHDRRVGLLQQDAMLFPHLPVAANVAFGPRCGGNRRAASDAARKWLAHVGAQDLSQRMPRELSGGQAQRVALARALAAEPEVLLLDEPMAGLDVAAATAMRTLLRQVLTAADRCAVLVTHDLLDVTALADRMLIIDDGRIVESGPVAAVLAAPSTAFGARFAGVNVVPGSAGDAATMRTTTGQRLAGVAVGATRIDHDQSVIAVFSPSVVQVDRERPPVRSEVSTLAVTVAELDHRGAAIRVRAEPLGAGAVDLAADISGQRAAELRLIPGERVFFTVAVEQVAIRPVG